MQFNPYSKGGSRVPGALTRLHRSGCSQSARNNTTGCIPGSGRAGSPVQPGRHGLPGTLRGRSSYDLCLSGSGEAHRHVADDNSVQIS